MHPIQKKNKFNRSFSNRSTTHTQEEKERKKSEYQISGQIKIRDSNNNNNYYNNNNNPLPFWYGVLSEKKISILKRQIDSEKEKERKEKFFNHYIQHNI